MRMESLFVLKKKFGSGRVVRKIYEFADERKYWLNKYRYVINNGLCNYYDFPLYSDYKRKAFRLATGSRFWKGLTYNTKDIIEYYGLLEGKQYMHRLWEQRCENARNNSLFYNLNVTRLKFMDNWGLRNCLITNGITCIPETRIEMIKMIIAI